MSVMSPVRGRLFVLVLIAGCAAGIAPAADDAAPVTTAAAAAGVASAFVDAINRGDAAGAMALAAAGIRHHGPTGPVSGPAGLYAPYTELRTAMRDLQISARRIVSEGDLVAIDYAGHGTQRGPYPGVEVPGGHPVEVSGMELLRIIDGHIAERWLYLDRLALLQQMTDPFPAPAADVPVAVELLERFDPPVFLESVLPLADGSLLVSSLFEGAVYRIGAGGGRELFFRAPIAQGPGFHGAMCLVADGADGYYLTVIDTQPQVRGVWHLNVSGAGRQLTTLPSDVAPNGLARTANGDLLVADSFGARVWRVTPAGEVSVWSADPLLAPRPHIGRFPGPNGIQVWNGAAYVAISDRAHIVRIPIRADGSAGAATIAASGIGGDDFAIDDTGSFYVTTHPFDALIKIAADGTRTRIAGAEDGIVGPTAAALATDAQGRKLLYVITDGGLYRLPESEPMPPSAQTPGVFRLRLE